MTPLPNRPGTGRLILCFGNPARKDDGIGPAIAERLEELSLPAVRVESNYQLCVEDALAAAESGLVVFVDAAASGSEPYALKRVLPREGADYTTHSLEPDQVLGLARLAFGRSPEAYLLAIRGYSFDWFEEGLTGQAQANLEAALDFLVDFLRCPADGIGRRHGARRNGMREGKFVVLTIDDDDDVLRALRIVLEKNGYIVAEARSGEQGLREFKRERPDFILVDLMMESIDAGRNLVKELKLAGNEAPVYMLSSVGDELSASVDPQELGLHGVFQKPVNAEALLKTLRQRLKA